MRKLIIIIIFLITIFTVNLIFYFLSEDYRFFLKKIKNWDNVVYLEEKKYNDSLEKEILQKAQVAYTSKENEEIFELEEELWVAELKNEIILWKNYTDIIDIFSIYKLEKLELNSNLFDITDEYPDNYFEYYSKDLTLYLFPTKTYKEVYDIFSILKDELPYNINEINNFWDNSFYINLDKDIEDNFIRLLISKKWIVFWLKIRKTEYGLVKEKLSWINETKQIEEKKEELKNNPPLNPSLDQEGEQED